MRNMLRSRRGSAAFATVVALIPLIGAVALGAEGGSWYVTKQHAQNAADAAAYSGALQMACSLGGTSCTLTNSVNYSATQVAAQNAFCNAGDTSYPGSRCTSLPSGISQTVEVAVNGTSVQTTVSQQQPTYLAKVLGLSTINIAATATAEVNSVPDPPCALALTGSLSFQGSPNINAPHCGMATNDKNGDALKFTGNGASINLSSLSSVGGCTGSASNCNAALIYMPPVSNPFSALDGALTALCGANPTLPATCGLPNCPNTGLLVPYTPTNKCTNKNFSITGNKTDPLTPGVYFISGTLRMTGTTVISGTGVTFILLPGATIDTKGGGTLTLTGPTTVPSTSSLPVPLQPYAGLFQYMAMYDASATAVTFGGNSNINLTGNIYAPTAAVTFQGNPTINLGGGNGCGELIAASIAFNGNATFNSDGCSTATKPSITRYVRLVQ